MKRKITLREIRRIQPELFLEKLHASSSERRKIAELAGKIHFQEEYNYNLSINVNINLLESTINVDLVDTEKDIFMEVYSGLDNLRSGKHSKVSRDILKLSLLRNKFPGSQLYILVIDPQIEEILLGTSWLSYAIGLYNISVYSIPINEDFTKFIKTDAAEQSEVMYALESELRI